MQRFGERRRTWWVGRGASEEQPQLLPPAAAESSAPPPLVILARDGVGPLARRVHVLPDAAAAAGFIEYWYTENLADISALWTVRGEPGAHELLEWDAELLLLIRDGARPGIVYPFSFRDMDSARLFLRAEARRGLDLRHVILTWVVPVHVDLDRWGRAHLSPDRPPNRIAASLDALLALAERRMVEEARRSWARE